MARAVSPVVGVALLAFVAVTLSMSVGFVVTTTTPETPPSVKLSTTADADEGRIAITHEAGDALTVSELEVAVEIDSTELKNQPPVPFFSVDGFEGGPTGPFNTESPDEWHAGQTASFVVAETNSPTLSSDSAVRVTIVSHETVIYDETVTAQ